MGAVGQALQALGLVASHPALALPPAPPPLAGHFHHRPALPDHVQHRLIPLLSHAHVPHAGQHGPRCDTSTEVAATHQPKVWDTSGEGPMRHITRTRTQDKTAPCRIRTCDLMLRRHPLWSTELRGRGTADYKDGPSFEHHDRGQDESAAEILDRIRALTQDEHRQ